MVISDQLCVWGLTFERVAIELPFFCFSGLTHLSRDFFRRVEIFEKSIGKKITFSIEYQLLQWFQRITECVNDQS